MPQSPQSSQPLTCLSLAEFKPGILLLTLDMPGRGANILNQTLLNELDQALSEYAGRKELEGLIVFSAKPSIFIAGADLDAISQSVDWPDKEIVRFCERGRAVLARLSRLPFVTVAAIHGACVGGGLELALWCDCRVASDDRRTQLGLPEVKLGLIPGWAGTARLPRMIGFESAAQLMISGRLVSAAEANQLGFVDLVTSPADLLEESAKLIRRVKTSESFIHHRKAIMGPVSRLNQESLLPFPNNDPTDSRPVVEFEAPAELAHTIRKLGEQIIQPNEIYPFAPTVLLEHLARSAYLSQSDAWKSESQAMTQVWGSPANRGLLNHFFLLDRNKKQPGLVDMTLHSAPVQTVAIVGAGLMGRAIAENCVARGISVLLFDADGRRASESAAAIESKLSSGATKRAAAAVKAIANLDELSTAQWVIESVVETEPVKLSVLEKIEAAVSAETLIASNTSAIPISKLARALQFPARFCGIHFCHPELMALVEVPCGDQSSETTLAAAVRLVRQLGKLPIAMNDGPGFVVNRLLAAMINQAIQLLISGVPARAIDESVREFGFLGGPFEIIDTIGVDTCMYAGRTMWEQGLTCVTLTPILPKLVKLGRLGRKSGWGIYRYPTNDSHARGELDPQFAAIVAPYQAAAPETHYQFDDLAVLIVSAMVHEGVKILDEEIVGDLRDIELCAIHGLSFPQHRGGLFYWADQTGLSETLLGPGRTFYALVQQCGSDG